MCNIINRYINIISRFIKNTVGINYARLDNIYVPTYDYKTRPLQLKKRSQITKSATAKNTKYAIMFLIQFQLLNILR